MKETISVNLASQAFTFDKDAYHAVPDSFRRSVAVGLHHPVDRDSVGTFELYLFEI